MPQALDFLLIILPVLGLLIASGLFLRSIKKLQQKQFRAGFSNAIYTLLILFIVAVSALLASNILIYHRLSYETPVARLHIKQLDKQRFEVSVVY